MQHNHRYGPCDDDGDEATGGHVTPRHTRRSSSELPAASSPDFTQYSARRHHSSGEVASTCVSSSNAHDADLHQQQRPTITSASSRGGGGGDRGISGKLPKPHQQQHANKAKLHLQRDDENPQPQRERRLTPSSTPQRHVDTSAPSSACTTPLAGYPVRNLAYPNAGGLRASMCQARGSMSALRLSTVATNRNAFAAAPSSWNDASSIASQSAIAFSVPQPMKTHSGPHQQSPPADAVKSARHVTRSPSPPVGVEAFLASEPPSGTHVLFNMLSTWGDETEIGICELQIFDEAGHRLVPSSTRRSSSGASVPKPPFHVIAETLRGGVGCLHAGAEGNSPGSRGMSPLAAASCPPSGSPPQASPARMLHETAAISDAIATGQSSFQAPPHQSSCFDIGAHNGSFASLAAASATSTAHNDHVLSFTPISNTAAHRLSAAAASVGGAVPPIAAQLLQKRHDPYNCVSEHPPNCTDEAAMFVTPFVDGAHHLLCVSFQHAPVTISCIRVANYCGGGRTKTSKGVRVMEITVDDVLVFRGEIRESTSAEKESASFETILFTESEDVLRNIVASTAGALVAGDGETTVGAADPPASAVGSSQATQSRQAAEVSTTKPTALRGSVLNFSCRAPPSNAAPLSPSATTSSAQSEGPVPGLERATSMSLASCAGACVPCAFPSQALRGITSMCIQVESTWGDSQYFGISGLRLRDPQGRLIAVVDNVVINRPSGRRDDGDALMSSASLFDEDASTACAWAFEPGVQLILTTKHPVDVGFVEVANYSLGKRTHCGLKRVRFFASTAPLVTSYKPPSASGSSSRSAAGGGGGAHESAVALLYARVWDAGADIRPHDKQLKSIVELTPNHEPIALRKSPSYIPSLRFQSFDLSLADASARSSPQTHSMRFSMEARTKVAIRRARLSLLECPDWLLRSQLYLPNVLPLAYTYKIQGEFVCTSQAALKHVLRQWIIAPHSAIQFVSDDGASIVSADDVWCEGFVSAVAPTAASNSKQGSPDDAPLTVSARADAVNPATLPTGGAEEAHNGNDVLHVAALNEEDDDATGGSSGAATAGETCVRVELAFVADAPFAISAVLIQGPAVVLERTRRRSGGMDSGCSDVSDTQRLSDICQGLCWLRRLRIIADDEMVYESAAVGCPRFGRDLTRTVTDDAALHNVEKAGERAAASGVPQDGEAVIPKVVFFTLDDRVLQQYRSVALGPMTHVFIATPSPPPN